MICFSSFSQHNPGNILYDTWCNSTEDCASSKHCLKGFALVMAIACYVTCVLSSSCVSLFISGQIVLFRGIWLCPGFRQSKACRWQLGFLLTQVENGVGITICVSSGINYILVCAAEPVLLMDGHTVRVQNFMIEDCRFILRLNCRKPFSCPLKSTFFLVLVLLECWS